MKKIFTIILTIAFMALAYPISNVRAADNASVFNGLYLIDGEVDLTRVTIDVSIDNSQSSKIISSYEITNKGKETQYLTLGTPITSLSMTNFKSSFSPYVYNSIVVNGSKINQKIEQVDVDFDNWRNYSFDLPLKAGETKTATISYTIENKQLYNGKVTFDMDMQHLKTWGKEPNSVEIKANFNPKTVKIYNFDSDFSVQPTEITDEYGYIWKHSEKEVYKDINFQYYFIDDEIIRQLQGLKSGQINTMISSYNSKDYKNVIESGKNYISNSQNGNNQNKVYLLMVDAYIALKEYDKALAIYDLIGTGLGDFGEIEQKIESKILYSKVICYKALKQYEDMYDLIEYELNYTNQNTYMVSWLEKQITLIPEKELTKIKETRVEPTEIQKLVKKFMQGEFHTYLFLGVGVVIIIAVILILIRRKKKKNRFFY